MYTVSPDLTVAKCSCDCITGGLPGLYTHSPKARTVNNTFSVDSHRAVYLLWALFRLAGRLNSSHPSMKISTSRLESFMKRMPVWGW